MELTLALQESKMQWENLESIYNEVTDPTIMDSIIHQIIVAEQTYNQLLQKARKEGISVSEISMR